MLMQIALLCKGTVAAVADVTLALGLMDHHVRPQVRSVSECSATTQKLTLVRALPSMSAHVPFQKPGSGEDFSAHKALVAMLVMAVNMTIISLVDSEHLVAYIAFMDRVANSITGNAMEVAGKFFKLHFCAGIWENTVDLAGCCLTSQNAHHALVATQLILALW